MKVSIYISNIIREYTDRIFLCFFLFVNITYASIYHQYEFYFKAIYSSKELAVFTAAKLIQRDLKAYPIILGKIQNSSRIFSMPLLPMLRIEVLDICTELNAFWHSTQLA